MGCAYIPNTSCHCSSLTPCPQKPYHYRSLDTNLEPFCEHQTQNGNRTIHKLAFRIHDNESEDTLHRHNRVCWNYQHDENTNLRSYIYTYSLTLSSLKDVFPTSHVIQSNLTMIVNDELGCGRQLSWPI